MIGAGPAGLTAAYELMKAGRADRRDDPRVDRRRRRHQPDRAARRLALRHRRPPLLHEGHRGRRALGRDPRARDDARPAAPEPHALPGQALRLPARADERVAQPRARSRRCAASASYLWVRVRPPKNQDTLEGFYAARFGWRLYRHFFKTYTEKVWGVPASRALGRLGRAAREGSLVVRARSWEAVKPKRFGAGRATASHAVTSLIEEFKYPKFGPGMMWEVAAEKVDRRRRDARVRPHGSRGSRHDGDGAHEVRRGRRRRQRARLPVHARDLVDAARRAVPGDGPAGRHADRGGGGRAALPRPPHGRARRRRRSTRSPTTGSTCTTPRSRSAACRTTARGRRSW